MSASIDTASGPAGQAATSRNPKRYQTLSPGNAPRPIYPHDYLHRVKLWVPWADDPHDHPELLAALKTHCRRTPRIDRRYHGYGWNLTVVRPDAIALALLAQQTTWRVAGLEIAHDFIFNTQAEADQMKLLLARLLVMLHPGKHQKLTSGSIEFWGQPRRGRPRRGRPSRVPAAYSDLPCHLTRERNCCHLEMRFHGCAMVAKHLGIVQAPDLCKLTRAFLEAYWDRNLRRNLKTLDFARLGRDQRNRDRAPGQPRRRGYLPDDANYGRRLANLYGSHRLQRGTWTMQQYIRNRGCGPGVIPFELPRGYARAILRSPSHAR